MALLLLLGSLVDRDLLLSGNLLTLGNDIVVILFNLLTILLYSFF